VGALPGTRSLDGGRQTHTATDLGEGAHVLGPRLLVEVDRKEPAGFVLEEGVHAHDMSAGEVADHRRIVDRGEGLVRAVAALHLGQLADASYELVPAGRRVAGLPGLLAHEPRWENILAPAEQRPEKLDLVGGRPRRRRIDGEWQRNTDLRAGAEGRQLCPERGQPAPRIRFLGREPGEASLLVGDRLEQCVAAGPAEPWLVSGRVPLALAEPLPISDGETVEVTVTAPSDTAAAEDAIRATPGAWADLLDCEAFERGLYERRHQHRSPVPL
jgi:hypothetical protein